MPYSRVIGKKDDGIWRGASVAFFQRILALLRIALIVALIMGVVAATDISDHGSQSNIRSIKTYRTVNAALIFGAIGGSAVLGIMAQRHNLLPIRAMIMLVTTCSLIVRPSNLHLPMELTRVAHYCCLQTGEYIETTGQFLAGRQDFVLRAQLCGAVDRDVDVVSYWRSPLIYFNRGLSSFVFNVNELFVDPTTSPQSVKYDGGVERDQHPQKDLNCDRPVGYRVPENPLYPPRQAVEGLAPRSLTVLGRA